ncbi:MAG: serine hydrolase domain-containing protein [Bacteroidota bacterium]
MNKYVAAALFSTGLLFSSLAQELEPIERKIDSLIAQGELPSMAIGIFKDGKVLYSKAFGYADIEKGIRSTVKTPYQLASLTKPITAMAIMKLHQSRIIELDDPISKFIPVQKVDSTFRDPTIRQVLNHTAGLGTYFDLSYADEEIQPQTFLDAWNAYGTVFQQPGEVSEYSNLGYGLLDYIIDLKINEGYGAYLKSEIFAPLQMKNAFLIADGDTTETLLAKKYGPNQKELPFIWNNAPGAGNVAASVEDLLKFGAFHLQITDKKVLRSEHLQSMQQYREPNALFHYYEDTYYSLGWYVRNSDRGQKVVWHEGGMMGASTVLKLSPNEKIAVAVVTNTYAPKLLREITDNLVAEFIPEYQPSPLNEIANYQPAAKDSSFLGTWKGTIQVEGRAIPFSLNITENDSEIQYIDFEFSSFLTDYQPIPVSSKLLMGIHYENYFLGTGIGNLPAKAIRKEFPHFLSLKLYRKGNQLTGTIVNLAAAQREYYALPYAISLKKQ